MNNTLTGLGVALVLALLAALVGPWFVNWTAYRDDFAAQAAAIVGAPVTLTGAVDARLLPTPFVRFHGLKAGSSGTALSVDEVEIELAIAPLLRGDIKVERLKLVRPRMGVVALADGAVRTAFSSGKAGAPAKASFDRAEIVDGSLAVETPAGRHAVERVNGSAEAGSLSGPFRFEGAVATGQERLRVKLSTARLDARGAMRAKLSVEREGHPETLEADGALTVAARPAFDGRVVLARAPPRLKAGEDENRSRDAWRIAAELKAEGGRARAEKLDVSFGPDDRAVRFGGRVEAALAETPRLDLALESRQIDLDRAFGPDRPKTPAAMLQGVASRFTLPAGHPIEGRVSLDLRGLVLAGDVVRDVRAELKTGGGAWRIERASAVMPGETALNVSGRLGSSDAQPGFAGNADFSTRDLTGFRRWLAGGEDQGASLARRFAVKGDVRAAEGSIAIDNAEFAADGARSTGRFAWSAGARPRLDVTLKSDSLDLDALGLDRVLSRALRGGETDVALALEARTLALGGVRMDGVAVDASLDESGVDIRRLDIRDAAGARISGAGRIAPGADGPAGSLDFKVAAADVAPLMTLARAAGASGAALDGLAARAAALSPVALALKVEVDAKGRVLTMSGDAAGGRLEARGSTAEFSLDAPAEIDLRLTSQDGRRLASLVGLSLSPVASAPGGEITVRLSGAPARDMKGQARFAALGLDLSMTGAATVAPAAGFSAQGDVTLKSADLAAFAVALGRMAPDGAPEIPVALSGKAAISIDEARFEDVSGEIAGRPVAGRLTAPFDPARAFEGRVAFEELPAAAIAALALSPDALSGAEARSVWPAAVFGPSPARGLNGRIDVKAARAPLWGDEVATDATFTLGFRRNAVVVESLSATFEGGRLSGATTLTRSDGDAALNAALKLEGARAERIGGLRPETSPVRGVLDLRLEAQGAGRTFSGLVGTLTGAGTAILTNGVLRGLDPASIDRVEPAVEAGLALEGPRIADAVDRGLAQANLPVGRAVAPFTISGGVVRTGAIASETADARLGGALALDLRRLTLDADLTLQPSRSGAPQVGVSFEGPLSGPRRRIDATDLTAWLSVRAVERETRRIDAMEADIRERAKIARQRAEQDRKRLEEERRRAEDERRRVEAERRKRDAEARALVDTLPRPSSPSAPALPSTLDIAPPGGLEAPEIKALPPTGVFGRPDAQGLGARDRGGETGRPGDRPRATQPDALSAPQSILPPGTTNALGR